MASKLTAETQGASKDAADGERSLAGVLASQMSDLDLGMCLAHAMKPRRVNGSQWAELMGIVAPRAKRIVKACAMMPATTSRRQQIVRADEPLSSNFAWALLEPLCAQEAADRALAELRFTQTFGSKQWADWALLGDDDRPGDENVQAAVACFAKTLVQRVEASSPQGRVSPIYAPWGLVWMEAALRSEPYSGKAEIRCATQSCAQNGLLGVIGPQKVIEKIQQINPRHHADAIAFDWPLHVAMDRGGASGLEEIEVRQGLAGKRPSATEWAQAIGNGPQSEGRARWLAQSGFLRAQEARALLKLQGLGGRARAAFEHAQLQEEVARASKSAGADQASQGLSNASRPARRPRSL